MQPKKSLKAMIKLEDIEQDEDFVKIEIKDKNFYYFQGNMTHQVFMQVKKNNEDYVAWVDSYGRRRG